jgi:DNA (cytosine-5)-methyltransferase 1
MVFDEVQADLEAEGYEVLPFLLPACAVGAPHRRDRIWFIAHSNGKRLEETDKGFRQKLKLSKISPNDVFRGVASQWSADRRGSGKVLGVYGLSKELDGITVSEHTKESIKAMGNAIVPQVAYELFKVINQMEKDK